MNCPACNYQGAYIGFKAVECPNPDCKHFDISMVPKKGQEPDTIEYMTIKFDPATMQYSAITMPTVPATSTSSSPSYATKYGQAISPIVLAGHYFNSIPSGDFECVECAIIYPMGSSKLNVKPCTGQSWNGHNINIQNSRYECTVCTDWAIFGSLNIITGSKATPCRGSGAKGYFISINGQPFPNSGFPNTTGASPPGPTAQPAPGVVMVYVDKNGDLVSDDLHGNIKKLNP